MPEMLSPAILHTSMPSTAGATIRIPPARAASGAYPSGSTVSRWRAQCTTSRGSRPDGERFFQADASPVLTLRADYQFDQV